MNNFKNAFIQYGLDHGHIKPIKETIKKYKIIKFRKSGTLGASVMCWGGYIKGGGGGCM